MTLTQYLRVLRQHWLIVLLLAALGVGAAAAYTSRQTPIYQAQTQVFVSAQGPGSGDTLSDLSQGSTFSQQRVKSYASMVTSSAVTEPVVKQLRLPTTPSGLAGQIDASPQLDTVLIDITVSDPDPQRAADIARAAASQLQTVVDDLETNGGQTESRVKLTTTRAPAVPSEPVSPRVPLNIALGLLLGLGLGVGAAVLRDQLNTTLRGSGDLELLTGSVPLGVVPFDAGAPKQPLVTTDAFGGRAEAFRTLRTNLQFADVDNPPRVIAVTSALPDEGKTTTACNIALILAQSGARVVLVEGDLRKPAVGKYLGISNAVGLTNVLAGQHDLRDVVVGYDRDLLAVLPSGPTPPNPSELLGSQQMRHLLDTLAQHYDVVVVDAPPLLPVTDAALIATAADGAILVVRHGRSRREEAERALQALEAVSAKLLGTVLNFAPRKKGRNGYEGYGYGYGQPPAESPEPEKTSRRERRQLETAPPATSITLPDAGSGTSRPLEPLDPVGTATDPEPEDESWGRAGTSTGAGVFEGWTGARTTKEQSPEHRFPDGGPGRHSGGQNYEGHPVQMAETASRRDQNRPSAEPRAWAPDMGYAPSPSDGWAPVHQSRATQNTGGISVYGGLSSTGPLPVVTAPGTDGLAVISRTDGLEISRTVDTEEAATQVVPPRQPDRLEVVHTPEPPLRRRARATAEDVPQALRLQPLPSSPDTAPSGIPVAAPAPEQSWFAEQSPAEQSPAELAEEIPPLLVDLSAPDLNLLEDERELLIPPQSVMPHVPTGVPRHHRAKRSL